MEVELMIMSEEAAVVPGAANGTERAYTKVLVPLLVVAAVLVLVGVSSQRWDRWTAGADTQSTDNAYVRAELSRLSARVAGNVSSINVSDFDQVKAGDLLLQIDPSDYEAKRDQAKAALDAAIAQLGNLDNQKNLQRAAIRQAEAQSTVANANAALAKMEADRQVALMQKGAGTQQKNEQAQAALQSTAATALATDAAVVSAKAQLQYIEGQTPQLAANVAAARAALKTADLALSYTKIMAPFDGVVSERQVHVGDYVTVGTNSIAIVPLPAVYLIANFKETQLSRMKEGQAVTVTVDALPGESFTGKLTRLSPASGSQFALLPADNATGNFTKVVQRVPVRIDFDASPALERLRSGMSAVVSVSVGKQGS
ncbi:HlyD family efflux transporter periplasmic adaptor subunit [Rhizobium leguminosarum bv. viciae]|nr:HlyD family efflux transporter periplasmic adaptor subunit [Rhizobium leguminosarum bv. viciae]